MATKLYRLPETDRFVAARQHLNKVVRLTYSANRDATCTTYIGRLISIATTHFGTVSDIAILRMGGDHDTNHDSAFSLATVARIEPL